MRRIMSGEMSPVMIAGVAHRPARQEGDHRRDRRRGAGDARVRDARSRCRTSTHLVDIVGTGGDGAHTFNISTASMFVAAAAGARVGQARQPQRVVAHRAAPTCSRRSAPTSTLHAGADRAVRSTSTGIGFMFAPSHHAAMKHAAPVRKELGVRTIFNILGPLTNPAGAPNQLMGVFHPDLVGIQVRVLQRLGAEHVMVVYGTRRHGRDLAVGRRRWSAS